LVTSAVPRLTWLFLPLLALSFAVAALRGGGDWRRLIKPNAALIAMLLVTGCTLLSAVWAANPAAAIGKGALLFFATLITFAAIGALAEVDAERLRRPALAFAAGAFLGGLFILFELLTDAALARAFGSLIAWLKPAAAQQAIHGPKLNQNVAIVMFNLWSGLLALQMFEGRKRRAIASFLFALAIAVPVVLSYHQSSQLALLLSVFVFLLAQLWPKAVVRTLAAVWCLGFALVLPLSFAAYNADLHLASWMPSSFKARIIIWEYTAERALERPWIGIGARSTRDLRQAEDLAEKPEGFVLSRNTGIHAHNIFLQSWYELGLVGVILIAFASAMIALRISLLPLEVVPFAGATFTTFLATASVAWGMWQTWLICAVGLMAVYLRLAVAARRKS
jgi:O-antigen ligase